MKKASDHLKILFSNWYEIPIHQSMSYLKLYICKSYKDIEFYCQMTQSWHVNDLKINMY